jgi:hypothetical protein
VGAFTVVLLSDSHDVASDVVVCVLTRTQLFDEPKLIPIRVVLIAPDVAPLVLTTLLGATISMVIDADKVLICSPDVTTVHRCIPMPVHVSENYRWGFLPGISLTVQYDPFGLLFF